MSPEFHPKYPNRPLRPDEVLETQKETFPEEVFIAVNGLIAERMLGQCAKFTVKALKQRMVELGLERKEIEERGWDRVGALYKAAGWNVSYHSSAWDDETNFDPYYFFMTESQRSW